MTIVNERPLNYQNLLNGAADELHANDVPSVEERCAILGHEIRNPLSALTYALQAWPAAGDDPQLTENLLQIMRRQVAQLTRLCSDLLDVGTEARRKTSVNLVAVCVKNVIHNACEELRPFIEQCGHTLTITMEDAPCTLLGDNSRLTQVFANILHNSAKFTDGNGQLHVSMERDQDVVVISLRDNGRGIGAEKLKAIFPVAEGTAKCSRIVGDNLGIGLRLAKTIVELHGGTIAVFSEGLGHGSTFVVRLPIMVDQLADTADKPNGSALLGTSFPDRGSQLPPYRIVVVDDDRSLRFLLSRMLRKLGQLVLVAENGDTALEIIQQHQPHFVFLDLKMQGLSGYDVAQHVRSRVEMNHVVLIALSGSCDAASRRMAAESGFDQYLVKPTSMAELTETLQLCGELVAH